MDIRQSVFSLFGVIVLVTACGKPANEKKKSDDDVPQGSRRSPLQNRVEFLKKQDVQCASSKNCLYNMAKVVSIYEEKYRTCSAVLVTEDKLLIPTACIPEPLRYYNVGCSNNLYFFFPNKKVNGEQKQATKFLCNKILRSDYYSDQKDPSLVKNGLSLISLIRKVESWRKPIRINKKAAFKDSKDSYEYKYDVYSFKQLDDYQGKIQKGECKVYFNTYANPFGSHPQSPVHMASGCNLNELSSGSLFFNPRRKKLLGILRNEFDYKKFENFLKKELAPGVILDNLYYVQSMGCLTYRFKDFDIKTQQDVNHTKECNPLLSEKELLKKRISLKYKRGVHRENINQAQKEVWSIEKYWKWNIHFKVKNDLGPTKANRTLDIGEGEDTNEPKILSHIYPDCFFEKNTWIYKLKDGLIRNYLLPKYEFLVKYGKHLRPVSTMNKSDQKVRVKFSLKKVKRGYTKVNVNVNPSAYRNRSDWVIPTRCFSL
ncbi:hypothetical protein N9N67_03495 [Bacteriovoracaceae bacterium]|nr:hypothetical protein [Bacteriovoracaceae bacterium]